MASSTWWTVAEIPAHDAIKYVLTLPTESEVRNVMVGMIIAREMLEPIRLNSN